MLIQSSHCIQTSQQGNICWRGLINYKILRTNGASSSKGVGTLICFPKAMLNLNSRESLQAFFAIHNNDNIVIHVSLIFQKQINYNLRVKLNYNICQI